MAEAIHRRKIYQEVLDRLSERIRNGSIQPGAQLPSERELMEEYGVGRPAVREALQELQRSGIVEILHGERARVVVPTAAGLISQIAGGAMHLLRSQPQALEQLKDARIFLEVGMARLAAQRATEEQVLRLQLALARQRAAISDPEVFLQRDMDFHRELAAINGNPIFPSIVEAVFRWASEHYRTLVRAPGAEELTLAEHQRIADAVAARDGEKAAEAMHAHLTRASHLYVALTRPG